MNRENLLECEFLAVFYGQGARRAIERGDYEGTRDGARCAAHWAMRLKREKLRRFFLTWMDEGAALVEAIRVWP